MNTNSIVTSAKPVTGFAGTRFALPSKDSTVPKNGYEAFLPTLPSAGATLQQIGYVRPSTPCDQPISRSWANNILDRRRAGERVSDVLVCRALVITGDA